jgi:hypothetical protein
MDGQRLNLISKHFRRFFPDDGQPGIYQLTRWVSTDKRASRELAVATKSRLPGINLANWLTVLGLCRF